MASRINMTNTSPMAEKTISFRRFLGFAMFFGIKTAWTQIRFGKLNPTGGTYCNPVLSHT
jgi:hypothetical protein